MSRTLPGTSGEVGCYIFPSSDLKKDLNTRAMTLGPSQQPHSYSTAARPITLWSSSSSSNSSERAPLTSSSSSRLWDSCSHLLSRIGGISDPSGLGRTPKSNRRNVLPKKEGNIWCRIFVCDVHGVSRNTTLFFQHLGYSPGGDATHSNCCYTSKKYFSRQECRRASAQTYFWQQDKEASCVLGAVAPLRARKLLNIRQEPRHPLCELGTVTAQAVIGLVE